MPDFTPSFNRITAPGTSTPSVKWFSNEGATLPDVLAPYLAAHGFKIESVSPYLIDGEFAGWGCFMGRTRFVYERAAQDVLGRMTLAYNAGQANNDTRYADLLKNFAEVLDKTQAQLTTDKTLLDGRISAYLTTIDDLESSYDAFFVDVKANLESLTVTMDADRTRVNNQFDTLVAAARQQMTNQGFYSSAMRSVIEAGIEERRALALTEITEREQRLIAEITLRKNEVYVNVLQMRSGLIQAKMALTNREMEFLAYQLDTRNNLAIAMFGVVERREDGYPGLGDMAQVVASLGSH